jgi:hypothetical protein
MYNKVCMWLVFEIIYQRFTFVTFVLGILYLFLICFLPITLATKVPINVRTNYFDERVLR